VENSSTTSPANGVYTDRLKTNAIRFLHAAAFSPTTATWTKAIDRGHFKSWPLPATPKIIRHLLPKSIPTAMGHLDQLRKNKRSTKPTQANTAPLRAITEGGDVPMGQPPATTQPNTEQLRATTEGGNAQPEQPPATLPPPTPPSEQPQPQQQTQPANDWITVTQKGQRKPKPQPAQPQRNEPMVAAAPTPFHEPDKNDIDGLDESKPPQEAASHTAMCAVVDLNDTSGTSCQTRTNAKSH
jgi:hypothetical protein